MIDGKSIANISVDDWKSIAKQEKIASRKYMDERNAKLYVDLKKDDKWYHPKGQGVTEEDVMRQQTTCSLTMGLLMMLCMGQPITSLDGVSFGVQASTGTPSLDMTVNGQRAAVVVALAPMQLSNNTES